MAFDFGSGDVGFSSSGSSKAERNEAVERALAHSHAGQGGWARATCPFCYERVGKVDTKYCLSIRVDSGAWHCWRCGARGFAPGAADALSDAENQRAVAEGVVEVDLGPPPGFCAFGRNANHEPLLLSPARAYIETRRLARGVITAAGIGACVTGEFAGRVVVPTFGDKREWLGWVGRDYTGRSNRPYHTCAGMPKAEMLYNQAAVFVETDVPVYVVEGVFDALALWPDAVAVWGKPSVAHENILRYSKRPVVIALDGDAWREAEAMSLRMKVDGHTRVGFVRLPATLDPDEVPREWLDEEAERSLNE